MCVCVCVCVCVYVCVCVCVCANILCIFYHSGPSFSLCFDQIERICT